MSEVGLIAVTRGIAGAGAGILIAGYVPEKNRRMIGWGLFALGALTTIPLLVDVIRKSNKPKSARTNPRALSPTNLDHHMPAGRTTGHRERATAR